MITLVPGTSPSAEDASKQFERVAATLHVADEDPEDVAVASFFYDAPPDPRGAIRTEHRNFTVERLQYLQAGLIERSGGVDSGDTAIINGVISHGTSSDQRYVVVGYSYGATVVSQASLSSGLYVSRVLLIAPPGAGPRLERANNMKLLKPDGTVRSESENNHRVAVATSPMDPIRIPTELGVHGKSPADKDFGMYAPNLSERGLPIRDLVKSMVASVQDIPQEHRHVQGSSYTEHYFDDEIFTRKTNRQLTDS